MPRVSAEHLEARRNQIIEAAVRCFARRGFHATSMQDVFAESGLSAGAVYRYFPSKSALVQATSEFVLRQLTEILETVADGPEVRSPVDLVHAVTAQVNRFASTADIPITRLAINAWAEALHDADVAAVVERIIIEVRGLLTAVAASWQEAGLVSDDTDAAELAPPLYSLLVGYLVQSLVTDDVDPDSYSSGIHALSLVDAKISGGHS